MARSTGLAGLDALFGGGIPSSTVHLCFGEPMNALDLMSIHFAAAGTTTSHTLFLSTQRSEKEVEDAVKMVGGKPTAMTVIELPHGGAWLPAEVEKGTRVVVDSLSDVIDAVGFSKTMAALKEVRQQVREADENMLVMVTSGLHTDEEMARLRIWADGVMELGFDRQGFGLYPFLKVTRMRGVPDASRMVLIKETEKGLTLDSTKRVF